MSLSAERFIVRVFDGRASAHTGPFRDQRLAERRADALAARARRRGANVQVSVRPLIRSGTKLDGVLDQLAEQSVYTARSFSGRSEAGALA